MDEKQITALFDKYKNGTLTADEKVILESWYIHVAKNSKHEISDDDLIKNLEIVASGLPLQYSRLSKLLWPMFAKVASVIIVFSVGLYLYSHKSNDQLANTTAYADDVAPGKNSATLTLADGRKILIKDALAGKVATQSGVKISKTADGQIIYEITNDNLGVIAYNTLSTTRGEQTKVRLPDGTLVFLNAASSLRYPTTFGNERKVELTGEAYFEVAHNKAKPFKVLSDGQEVKVLGTHFNVNSYTDEKDVRTTLLEGSIAVSSLWGTKQSQIIKPNEQTAISKTGAISVEQANVDDVVAWTKGKFVFEQEDITSVMRKLSRWYNVELEYRGNLKGKTFTGSISRFDNISKILDKITYTDVVHFKIEGRRVIIMP